MFKYCLQELKKRLEYLSLLLFQKQPLPYRHPQFLLFHILKLYSDTIYNNTGHSSYSVFSLLEKKDDE